MSEQRLAAASKRRLSTIQTHLTHIAGEWEELDECVRSDVEQAASKVGQIITDLDELYPPKAKRGAR